MKTNNNSVAAVKTVAPATTENNNDANVVASSKNTKPNFKTLESDYDKEMKNRYSSFVELSKQNSSHEWNGEPLVEDKVYHMDDMGGISFLLNGANRRTIQRAWKMLKGCEEVGMTTPAILVKAKLLADWKMPLVDPVTLTLATPEQIEHSYVILEGHGREFGWQLGIYYKMKNPSYQLFDFKFIYNEYATPEEAGNAYVNTNEIMTRTTNKDRLGIAGARCNNPFVIKCNKRINEDGNIAKASYFWTYGRELKPQEVSKLTKEEADAPVFNEMLAEQRDKVYEAFKTRFCNEGAEKIYRGVSAAQWTAQKLSDVTTAPVIADSICEKVRNMGEPLYTAIITAKTKKGKTRDQVIQGCLDTLMKQ